jgi:hypothetical protein
MMHVRDQECINKPYVLLPDQDTNMVDGVAVPFLKTMSRGGAGEKFSKLGEARN